MMYFESRSKARAFAKGRRVIDLADKGTGVFTPGKRWAVRVL